MGERTAGRGEGVSDNQKESKSTNRRRTERITPKKRKTTAMQNHDRERQEEVEEAAELWRLQETSARHKKITEGESQTVITRQHEVLSNTLQGGNSERNERNQRRKEKEQKQNRRQPTAHNTARVQLPHTLTASLQPKNITALFESLVFYQQCQQKVTIIRI